MRYRRVLRQRRWQPGRLTAPKVKTSDEICASESRLRERQKAGDERSVPVPEMEAALDAVERQTAGRPLLDEEVRGHGAIQAQFSAIL